MRLTYYLMLLALLEAKGCYLWQASAVGTNQTVSVSLTWDRSPDPSVTGYKVYWGTNSGGFSPARSLNVGTNVVATVTNLTANTKYYFTATAYNAPGLESDYAAEINYTPFNSPPTNAPTNLRVMFQMQVGFSPLGPFSNLAGALITITNSFDPLIPGFYYKTLISETKIQ